MNLRRFPHLAGSVAIAVGLISLLSFLFATAVAQAQITNQIVVDKQLGRTNSVVHVGEYLTFTIRIENQSQFTVTTLPLSDDFNNAVLAYADAIPAPDSVDPPNGQLEWNDLTTYFGDLPPGEVVTVTVGFIAEHPSPAVVNYAEVHDAIGDGGDVPGGGDTSDDGESIGGASPVDKKLVGGVIPQVGMPLTFTISITNDGYTTMTVVPLLEDYDPDFLQFSHAQPQPDTIDEVSGELNWSDLTVSFGDVGPQQVILITAVFTALAPIDLTSNIAAVSNAQDWYGNDVTAGADQVPITIIGSGQQQTPTPTAPATSTPTSSATSTPSSDNGATATPMPEATIMATRETAVQMPNTGIPPAPPSWPTWLLMAVGAMLPLTIWFFWRRRQPS